MSITQSQIIRFGRMFLLVFENKLFLRVSIILKIMLTNFLENCRESCHGRLPDGNVFSTIFPNYIFRMGFNTKNNEIMCIKSLSLLTNYLFVSHVYFTI